MFDKIKTKRVINTNNYSKQPMALSTKDKEEIVTIIKTTVNGKIDRLDQKLEAHLIKMDPVIDGLAWLSSSRQFVLWVGGIAASVASIIAAINIFR